MHAHDDLLILVLIVVASLGYHAPWRRGMFGLVAVAMSALVYDLLAAPFVLGDFVANAAIVVGAWRGSLTPYDDSSMPGTRWWCTTTDGSSGSTAYELGLVRPGTRN